MTTIWNPNVLPLLANGSLNLASQTITLALLYSYAVPTPSAPNDVNSLVVGPGFQELSGGGYARVPAPCNTTTSGGITQVVVGQDYPLTLTAPSYVRAGIWYVPGSIAGLTNPWLFISDDMFGNIVSPGAVVGTTAVPKLLFRYAPRGTTTVDISMGTWVQSPGPTTWESARNQHVYLFPQRVNWIPNPSFEDVGLFGWRASGTFTRVQGGVDNAQRYFGRSTGGVLESIAIPPQQPFRFSAYVRSGGATHVTLKLMCLDETYTQFAVIAGKTRTLPSGWIRVDDLLSPADDATAVIPRIEADGSLDTDLVLLEGTEALHDYFAGDSVTGMPYDFGWQGVAHQSYSTYYCNRNTTAARLFGGYFDGQVTKPSLVLDWVPSGTSIYTHWDVLNVNDTKHALKDWSPHTFVP